MDGKIEFRIGDKNYWIPDTVYDDYNKDKSLCGLQDCNGAGSCGDCLLNDNSDTNGDNTKLLTEVDQGKLPIAVRNYVLSLFCDYRVGDKVEVIDNTCEHGYKIGSTLTVKFASIYKAIVVEEGIYNVRLEDIKPYIEPKEVKPSDTFEGFFVPSNLHKCELVTSLKSNNLCCCLKEAISSHNGCLGKDCFEDSCICHSNNEGMLEALNELTKQDLYKHLRPWVDNKLSDKGIKTIPEELVSTIPEEVVEKPEVIKNDTTHSNGILKQYEGLWVPESIFAEELKVCKSNDFCRFNTVVGRDCWATNCSKCICSSANRKQLITFAESYCKDEDIVESIRQASDNYTKPDILKTFEEYNVPPRLHLLEYTDEKVDITKAICSIGYNTVTDLDCKGECGSCICGMSNISTLVRLAKLPTYSNLRKYTDAYEKGNNNKPIEKPKEIKPRFNPGDKVLVVANDCGHKHTIGTVLTIENVVGGFVGVLEASDCVLPTDIIHLPVVTQEINRNIPEKPAESTDMKIAIKPTDDYNGEIIIDYLKKLGGSNILGLTGTGTHLFYYITFKGSIRAKGAVPDGYKAVSADDLFKHHAAESVELEELAKVPSKPTSRFISMDD